jgi:hypothetical protein
MKSAGEFDITVHARIGTNKRSHNRLIPFIFAEHPRSRA